MNKQTKLTLDEDLERNILAAIRHKKPAEENYAGALLILMLGLIGVVWAIRDPEGLIKAVVCVVSQVHI